MIFRACTTYVAVAQFQDEKLSVPSFVVLRKCVAQYFVIRLDAQARLVRKRCQVYLFDGVEKGVRFIFRKRCPVVVKKVSGLFRKRCQVYLVDGAWSMENKPDTFFFLENKPDTFF
jgi:hypothetical protein